MPSNFLIQYVPTNLWVCKRWHLLQLEFDISGEHQGKKTSVRTTETSKLPCGREDREETNSTLPTASENIIGLLHCTLIYDMLKSNRGTKANIVLSVGGLGYLLGLVRNDSPSIVCYLHIDIALLPLQLERRALPKLAHDIWYIDYW